MSINFIGAVWDSGLYDGPRLLMMLALADHSDHDGWCFPNYDTLALKIRRNVKTVYRILSELEGEGAIRRTDGRIGICQPHVLDEVKRRADSRHARQTAEPPAVLTSENPPPTRDPAILNSENPVLTSENPILTSENEILNSETPFLIDPSINRHQDPSTTPAAAAPPGDPPPAAAADLRAAILDWIEFDDALTDKERAALDDATLLAWAYWVKLKQAEPHSGVYNPVGLVRAQWRTGKRPRADLLRLARRWLSLDDDARARLLGRLEWAGDFADPGYIGDLEDEFPTLPLSTAAAVYAATDGQLAPAALTPPQVPAYQPPPPPAAAEISAPDPSREPAQPLPGRPWPAWPDALDALEMSMTRATYTTWLGGSAATLDGDDLTIHVRSEHAVAWLRERLHPIVQRAVDYAAGRPLAIRYAAGLPLPEARP